MRIIKVDCIKWNWSTDETEMWVRKSISRSSCADLGPRSCLFVLLYHRCVGKQCQNLNDNRFDGYYSLGETGIMLWRAGSGRQHDNECELYFHISHIQHWSTSLYRRIGHTNKVHTCNIMSLWSTSLYRRIGHTCLHASQDYMKCTWGRDICTILMHQDVQ